MEDSRLKVIVSELMTASDMMWDDMFSDEPYFDNSELRCKVLKNITFEMCSILLGINRGCTNEMCICQPINTLKRLCDSPWLLKADRELVSDFLEIYEQNKARNQNE